MQASKATNILGIESSCDDTAAAVISNGKLLSNVVAGQDVHRQYGGVVPELASRAHQQHIIPVVDAALKKAGITAEELSAVAFTRGPGLLGSLLVGTSFAKSLALGLNIPLIDVHHMQAHIHAHFIDKGDGSFKAPSFPFLCLTVSGGHTQLVLMRSPLETEVLGETLDDAAGEAFDKAAKILGLPYPGGPLIDKYGREGNPEAYTFPDPKIPGLNFSFSGIKTAFLYFIRDQKQQNDQFVEQHLNDICASIQAKIVAVLMSKLKRAAREQQISTIAIAGGVSANSALRAAVIAAGEKYSWDVLIPPFEFCTDNAAMIAQVGLHKLEKGAFVGQDIAPSARIPMG